MVARTRDTKGSPDGLFVSWGLMLVNKWPSTTEVLSLSSSIIHTSVVIPVPILRAYWHVLWCWP
jgi:hypothetical protein